MMRKNLTIITLTYNSSLVISNLLSQLNKEKYEVVVVDNASKDKTAELVEQNFSQVKLIKLKQNIGFGRACNVALREVNTDFALLLNPDTVIDESDIDLVLEKIKDHSDIALASPIIHSCTMKDGKIIKGNPVQKPNDKSVILEDENFLISKFITGAGMFMNMSAMKKIGFFDEGFFLYCEDNELCKRISKKGYKMALVKGSKFYHLSGKSSELSEAELAKVYWHKFGWSKCYYVETIHNVFLAKLKSLAVILKALKIALKEKKFSLQTKAMLKGSFGYLIGFKAFDKNGEARG